MFDLDKSPTGPMIDLDKSRDMAKKVWNFTYDDASVRGVVIADSKPEAKIKAAEYLKWRIDSGDGGIKRYDPFALCVWPITDDYTSPEHPDVYDYYGDI